MQTKGLAQCPQRPAQLHALPGMWKPVLFRAGGCPILFGSLPETGIKETPAASNHCVKKDKVNHEVESGNVHPVKGCRVEGPANGYVSRRTSNLPRDGTTLVRLDG